MRGLPTASRWSIFGERRFQVVLLLSAGMVVAQWHRVDLSVAISSMAAEFGWNATEQGVALSSFYWTYSALLIPVGLFLDRYGIRAACAAGLVVWSLASCAASLTTGLGSLVAARMLVGAGEAVVTPASMRYIRTHFGEERRGLAVGLYVMSTKLGPALGFPLSAYLVATIGWRSMFAVLGFIGLIGLLPWFRWVERDREAAAGARAAEPRRSLRSLAADRALWGIVVGTFCYMYSVGFASTWLPAYLQKQHGMSLTQAGWYGGFSFFGMAVVAVVSGWWADRLIAGGRDAVKVRKAFTMTGLALAATPALAVPTGSLPLMLVASMLALAALGLVTANYWALTHTLMPSGNIATIVGVQSTGGHLATVIAPWLTGILIDRTHSFDAPVYASCGLLLLGVLAYGALVRRSSEYGREVSASTCTIPR